MSTDTLKTAFVLAADRLTHEADRRDRQRQREGAITGSPLRLARARYVKTWANWRVQRRYRLMCRLIAELNRRERDPQYVEQDRQLRLWR
jgi:hypothetical protein